MLQQQFDSISCTNKLFVSSSKPAFQAKLHKSSFAPAERLRNKIYDNYLVTLKLQLFTSTLAKFGLKGPFNKRTAFPRRDQVSDKLMSQPTDYFINGCSRRQMRDFKGDLHFCFILEKRILTCFCGRIWHEIMKKLAW